MFTDFWGVFETSTKTPADNNKIETSTKTLFDNATKDRKAPDTSNIKSTTATTTTTTTTTTLTNDKASAMATTSLICFCCPGIITYWSFYSIVV